MNRRQRLSLDFIGCLVAAALATALVVVPLILFLAWVWEKLG